MPKANILIVEDEFVIANDIASTLRKNGYNIIGIANNKESAFQIIEANKPDLILMDIMLNDKDKVDGIDLAKKISKDNSIPIIYLTAYTDEKTLERAKYTNPYGYILKPFEDKELFNNIEIALYKHKAIVETEKRHSLLQLINSFDEKISSLFIDKIVNNTIDFLINNLNIDNVIFYLIEKEVGGYILYTSDKNDISLISNSFLIKKEDTVITDIIKNKTIKIYDNFEETLFNNKLEFKFKNFGYTNLIIAPLFSGDSDIGAIALLLKNKNFSENIINMIEPLSNRLSMSLNNCILYESLKESEEKFRNFTDSLPQVVCEIDLMGNIKYVNDVGFELFGYTEEDYQKGLNAFSLVYEEDMEKLLKNLKLLINGEKLPGIEYRIVKKNKELISVEIYARVIKHNDIPIGFRTVIVDLTERKEREEKIRKLSLAVEQSPVSIVITDSNGKIEYVNPKFTEVTGYSYEEVIGKNPNILKSGFQEKSFYKGLWDTIKAGKEWKGLFNNKKKNGELFWESATISAIKNDKGEITHFIAIKEDITHKVIAEKKLEEEREKLSVTLKAIKDGVITVDANCNIILLNFSAEALIEYKKEEILGKNINSILNIYDDEQLTKESINPIKKVFEIRDNYESIKPCFFVSKTQKIKIIEISSAPIKEKGGDIIGVVLVLRDITEKYKMQEEIIKNKKLESVGLLAGGIAHDFNNILTAILGNITLGKIYANPGEKIYEILLEAEKACVRSRDLTQQLLTFSKGGAPIKKLDFIEDVIKESAEFLIRGSNVKLILEIDDNIHPVEFDAAQINQVINNIIINALQAMPEGGILKIRVKNEYVKNNNIIKEGKYVTSSFTDTGMGISPENLERIFDPYFTTKKSGSGLGLAISYSIIQKHNGYIFVESELNKGTTFKIYLPAMDKIIEKKKTTTENHIKKLKGRVLFMDDEDFIIDVGTKLLVYLGLEVEIAKDGETVLKKYKQALKNNKPFDVVIMDLTVPGGMGGKETMPKLLKIDPNVKAIVSSGYSNDEVMANYKLYGFKAVMVKPYKIEDLSKILEEILLKK